MTQRELALLDWLREFMAVSGQSPSIRLIAEQQGIGVSSAHRLIDGLVRQGALTREPGRHHSLRLAELPDLRAVPNDMLVAELARRGVARTALDPAAPRAVGQQVTCAADSCGAPVQRGHLMCRQHWFGLSLALRERILSSNARRDMAAFERAVTEARDLIDSGEWRKRA
jgi:hypothetical protein